MNETMGKEAAQLREELEKLLITLKHNKENVPLNILKTKYKKAYDTLCSNIKCKASDYATKIALNGIRICEDYLDEAVPIINGTIEHFRIIKQFSKAIFCHQDLTEFEFLAETLREKIISNLEPFYARHLALYITQECRENPNIPPLIYCVASHCFWQDEKWIPMELYKTKVVHPQGRIA